MDYLTIDNSINTIQNTEKETKSKSNKKGLFEILSNQKAFIESMEDGYDLIKINMKKLNVIYSNDLNNLDGSKVIEKNLVLI